MAAAQSDRAITPTSNDPKVLWEADFDRKVKAYYLLSTSILFIVTIIGIPLLIVYLLIGRWIIERHLQNLGCVLTERTLEIKKGILNKTESTIPLEKITDLQMFQGPIMRHFGLRGFKVETAGQSSGPGGSLVNIIGIVDAVEFRRAVLEQRDALARRSSSGVQNEEMGMAGESESSVLKQILTTLERIEAKMGDGVGDPGSGG